MLATAIIVFREVLEAALVVSIVLAATRGVERRGLWVTWGIGAGVAGACLVAAFAESLAQAISGAGQELFNAGVLLLAVAMLGWHNLWMGRHGRELAQQISVVGEAVRTGTRPLYVLLIIVALAVLREGAEVVLFAYGIAAGGQSAGPMLLGGVLGLAGGALLGLALYFGLVRIPIRHLFTVTGWLILLLAAGMASQASVYLVQAGLLPALGSGLWDTSAVLPVHTVPGQMLHVLIGYDDRPMGVQLIAYLATILTIGGLMLLLNRNPRPQGATAAAILVVLGAGVAGPNVAHATHKVYGPNVEYGETEIEYRGHYNFDSEAGEDGEHAHVLFVGRGFTPYWFSEIGLESEKEGNEDLKLEAIEWENRFQLTEQGRYWMDVGLLTELEFAARDDDPDEVLLAPLLQKAVSRRWVATLNPRFEREFGDNAEDEWELGYAWELRNRLRRTLEWGVEGFGETGELGDSEPWDEQEHEIGPFVSGSVDLDGPREALKYQVGLLFGVTDGAPDQRLAWELEYEF